MRSEKWIGKRNIVKSSRVLSIVAATVLLSGCVLIPKNETVSTDTISINTPAVPTEDPAQNPPLVIAPTTPEVVTSPTDNTPLTGPDYTIGTPSIINANSVYSDGYYNTTPSSFSFIGAAHEQGWTGKGVNVAVIDSGVQLDHPELIDRNISAYSAVADNSTDDTSGHGTFVLGIIGASPLLSTDGTDTDLEGIAYDSNIFSIKASTDGLMSASEFIQAVNLAESLDTKVTNISYGSTLSKTSSIDDFDISGMTEAMRASLSSDNSLIFSAGNERGMCTSIGVGCNVFAYIPLKSTDLQNSYDGAIIIVGAVDSNGVITDYSNKAGVSAPYFMVAFGGSNDLQILGLAPASTTKLGTGTSYAAPAVTGAFALLAQKYPYLTGVEIRDILFSTATDLGAIGVDEIYGNGLLNMEKAVMPIGELSIVTPSTVIVPETSDNTETNTHIADYSIGTPSTVDLNNIYTNTYYRNINSAIKAGAAYEQGWTGEGVKIAIINNGVDTTHPELLNRFSIVDTVLDNLDYGTGYGGTFAAGIIGASIDGITYAEYPDYDIIGVAYKSDLISIKAVDNNIFNDNDIARAIDLATSYGAKASNLSFARLDYTDVKTDDSGTMLLFAMRDALSSDNSLFISAGNQNYTCASNGVGCSSLAFNAVTFPDLATDYDGAYTVVGGVDSSNVISSNKAGVMADFFMVAPGEVLSLLPDRDMSFGNAADWATAAVTGGFALLAQKYPYLTGKEIQEILFASATDLGDVGVDSVYGHGLLNIENAMKPIGELIVQSSFSSNAFSSSSTKSYSETKLFSSYMFSRELSSVTIGAKDDFNRIFNMPVSNSTEYNDEAYSYHRSQEFKTNSGIFFLKNYDAVGLGYKKDNNKYSLVLDESLYGIKGEGAFEMDNPLTAYLNYERIMDRFSIYGTFGTGSAEVNSDSVINDISRVYSFGAGLKYTGDSFSVSFNIPTTVLNGGFNVRSAYSRDRAGNIFFSDQNVDLSNNDVTLETKLGYKLYKTKNSLFGVELLNNYKTSALNLYSATYRYSF